ncbi:MAG: tRNA uridine-5-carboxymethylaminomethyl(34) synthesis GTPase MnmE [Alistipes sp.]|nr:tRNA uridine-5-carboxymethylaminomethyl(34) synthesis GTPase MnmE [Alistipes sp.]
MIFDDHDTIVAPATPAGGALCLIRLSGSRAIELCDSIFRGRRALSEAAAATAHYGYIMDGEEVADDVVVTIFRAPHSYTGEDTVEVSTHGSRYVVERILGLFIKAGTRMAEAGEFTRRAYLAGRMDLSQAEAVADIIAADSRAAYAVASTQMRGGYSSTLANLRERLVQIVSLLELELDFSEEDVEFADRAELKSLLAELGSAITTLSDSFALGNALKQGVTVAIAGRPNVGKSTLLNALAEEDRAMVSAIAGTTRDTVEVVKNLGGVNYRFIDTAGLHDSADELERMGIERTTEAMRRAMIILWLTDDPDSNVADDLAGYEVQEGQKIYRVLTKADLRERDVVKDVVVPTIVISAKTGSGMAELQRQLLLAADATAAYAGDVIVSNRRHYDALCQANEALTAAIAGLRTGIPTDLLSEDIRQVVHHIGTITGEISSDDILHSIFANFCIGK